jgi:hypothetical protein
MRGDGERFLIEFHVIGQSVKVTALDPKTLMEISIVGDLKLSQRQLAQAAVRKLKYVIKKNSDETN